MVRKSVVEKIDRKPESYLLVSVLRSTFRKIERKKIKSEKFKSKLY